MISKEKLYDPNNTTVIICSPGLEAAIDMKSMHVTEVRYKLLHISLRSSWNWWFLKDLLGKKINCLYYEFIACFELNGRKYLSCITQPPPTFFYNFFYLCNENYIICRWDHIFSNHLDIDTIFTQVKNQRILFQNWLAHNQFLKNTLENIKTVQITPNIQ